MSAGTRLFYRTRIKALGGLKPGVLLELGFDDVNPNIRRTSVPGCTTMQRTKCLSVTTGPRPSLASTPATPSSRSYRPSPRNSGSNKSRRSFQLVSRGTTMIFTAYSGAPRCKRSSARLIAKHTKPKDSVAATIPTLPKIKPSFWPILRPATPTQGIIAQSSTLYYGDKPTFDQILQEIGKWMRDRPNRRQSRRR